MSAEKDAVAALVAACEALLNVGFETGEIRREVDALTPDQRWDVQHAFRRVGPMLKDATSKPRNLPRPRCVCGYQAKNPTDLDEHIMHCLTGGHAEAH